MIELVGTDNTLQDNTQQNFNLANATLNNSLQQNAQLLQNDQQRLGQNIEALRQQTQAKLGSDMAIAQAEGNPNNGLTGLLSGLAQGGLQYLDYSRKKELSDYQIKVDQASLQQKEQVAKQKSELEINEANFIQKYSPLRNFLFTDGFKKDSGGLGGALKFREQALELLTNSGLSSEQITKHATTIYNDEKEYSIKFLDEQRKKTEEVNKSSRDTIIAANAYQISTLTGLIKSNPNDPVFVKELANKAFGVINQFLIDGHPGLSEEDKQYTYNKLLENLYTGLQDSEYARAEIETGKVRQDQWYSGLAKLNEEARTTKMAPEEYRRRRVKLALDTFGRKPTGDELVDPDEPIKQAISAQKSANELRELNERAGDDAVAGLTPKDPLDVATFAWAFDNVPGIREAYEQKFGKVPTIKAASSLFSEYKQAWGEKDRLEKEIQDDNILLSNINRDDIAYIIRQQQYSNNPLVGLLTGAGVNSTQGMTEEQKAKWAEFKKQQTSEITKRQELRKQQIANTTSRFYNAGFTFNVELDKKKFSDRVKSAITNLETSVSEALNKQREEDQETQAGVKTPFKVGQGEGINPDSVITDPNTGSVMFNSSTLSNVNAFATVPITTKNPVTGAPARTKVILPFAASSSSKISRSANSRDYRNNRGTHVHAGEDIAVPVGTPIVFYMPGKVVSVKDEGPKKGYGKYITVKGIDGLYHRFAHLSSTNVEVGDIVAAGQTIGLSGNTGRSQGPHLHWEVRTSNSYGDKDTIDPIEYMAGQSVVVSSTKRPSGDTINATYKGGNQPRVPKEATILKGGFYIYNGKLGRINQPDKPLTDANKTYTPQNPAKTGYQSSMKPQEDIEDTHNYAYLANNSAMRQAINKGAKELGIPGAVLADIIHNETSFNPKTMQSAHGAGGKYGGIMGFGQDALNDISDQFKLPRITLAQLLKLPPEKQVPWMVKYFQLSYVKPHVQGKGAEYYAVAVFKGWSAAKDLAKNRNEVLKRKDGYGTSIAEYIRRLGRSVGRRWSSSVNRTERLLATTHTGYHEGCRVCEQLRRSDSFVPHTSQFA